MKTYYIDKPVEEGYTKEEDNTLDNMLEACEYMVSILDESKARQKYVEAMDKGAKKAGKEYFYRRAVYNEFPSQSNKDKMKAEDDKFATKRNEADRYENIDKTKRDYESANRFYNDGVRNNNKDRENEFRRKFNIPRGKDIEDKSRIGQRKPGAIKRLQDQKNALKEACLYILSRLDDIDE